MAVPFSDLQRMHEPLGEAFQEAFRRVLSHGQFVLGPEVEDFERLFAAAHDAPHAVGVASGYDALRIILEALGIGPGDEVVVPAFTFAATVFAVQAVGATPVLADVTWESATLDPAAVRAAISPRTRAVMPVHLFGLPADMSSILDAARGIAVIEDAAQAHGTRCGGRPAGALGTAGAFSFYPSKNLGGLGDGGMILTADADLASRARALRHVGRDTRGEFVARGTTARLDAVQAAMLAVKLPRLETWNRERRRLAAELTHRLEGLPLETPVAPPGREHVYHLFVVRTPRRDALQAHLRNLGIQTMVHYPAAIHQMRVMEGIPGRFPVSERLAREALSLPLFPGMTPSEVDAVTTGVRGFFTP